MDRHYRSLPMVIKVDAWLSFSAPLVVLVGIPLLVVLDAPEWLVATTVLTLAGILGGCGIIYAVVLSLGAARGRLEFPADVLKELRVTGLEDESPTLPSAR